ncbi:MAG TPA: hypothetical protein VMF13_15535 [Luteitalea sp.]|nr:hypothetical protein [Luteitalea sp.]
MATVARLAGVVLLITAGAVYPYLPGEYDPLAVPLSTVAQVGSVAALLLAPIGLAGLLTSANRSRRASLAGLAIVGLVMCGVAWATGGRLLGLIGLVAGTWLVQRWRRLGAHGTEASSVLRLALVIVPITAVAVQWLALGTMAASSRRHAIDAATTLVQELETHRATHGRYPASLTGAWPDYKPRVMGVERYQYTRHDDSYTLFFELPVPLLEAPGTREFVAYDPRGAYVMLSHAAWHVTRSPAALAQGQGWYATRDTERPGWRSFFFD